MNLQEWTHQRLVAIATMAAILEAGERAALGDREIESIEHGVWAPEVYARRAAQLFDAADSQEAAGIESGADAKDGEVRDRLAFVLFNNDSPELVFDDEAQAETEAEKRQRDAEANRVEGHFPSYWHVHHVRVAGATS